MNILNGENALFLIIDVQEKLVSMLNSSEVKNNAVIMAKTASILNIDTIITEQYPKGLGNTISEIKNTIINAIYTEKTAFSAYFDIRENLNIKAKKQIVLFGIETHICVLQTALDLINNGYEVFVVENACGSRNDNDKQFALKRLMHLGAQIITVEMVIFELLKSSKHPKFKEVQALIK